MQFSSSVLFSVLAALTATTAAAPTAKQPMKIDFDVKRFSKAELQASNSTSIHDGALRRSSSQSGVLMNLENEYSMYLAEIEIGTPAQKVKVDVDTGSSDLWVPGAGTKSDDGTYDHTKSSSYKKVSNNFQIGYGDGSYAKGDWAMENVKLSGTQASVKFQFGDATEQTAGEGVFGIGMIGNEASAALSSSSDKSTYPNFPVALKQQGYINKVGYSLYLNSAEATQGSVLFGAIDHAKYQGDLKTLDLVKIDDSGAQVSEAVAFFVDLDSISSGSDKLAKSSYPALLDSGTTLIYAPADVAKTIGEKYGTYNSQYGGYATKCASTGEDFTFTFGDKSINVPYSNMLFKVDDAGVDCLIGVLGSGSNYYILGDVFLRSSYIYYDLEASQVSLAQAKYTTSSNIEVIH